MSIKKTIALYHVVTLDLNTICEIGNYEEDDQDYIRISEPVEVDFMPINEAVVQEAMIKKLIDCREILEKKTEAKFKEIDQDLRDLRALPASC